MLLRTAGGELSVELTVGYLAVARQDGGAPGALQQRLPGAAAHHRIGDGVVHPAAKLLGPLRHMSEMSRQPAFDLGLDLAGKDRRRAFRADGDDDRDRGRRSPA